MRTEALQRQRTMYERQMQTLRNQLMSPSTPSAAAMQYLHVFSDSISAKLNPATSVQAKYHLWMEDREKVFKQSLLKLKEDVMKANVLVREANFLSREMNKQTNFSVTLQIPASNLSPNRKVSQYSVGYIVLPIFKLASWQVYVELCWQRQTLHCKTPADRP